MSDKAALLIIDVQKGGISKEMAWMSNAVESLQEVYQNVAAFRFINNIDSPRRKWINWQQLGPGSEETELAFSPKINARLFEKWCYTALLPGVQAWLMDQSSEEVHICGVRTENCILKTALRCF